MCVCVCVCVSNERPHPILSFVFTSSLSLSLSLSLPIRTYLWKPKHRDPVVHQIRALLNRRLAAILRFAIEDDVPEHFVEDPTNYRNV